MCNLDFINGNFSLATVLQSSQALMITVLLPQFCALKPEKMDLSYRLQQHSLILPLPVLLILLHN